MKVEQIDYDKAMEWCLKKHYSRRKPMYQYAYGLIINGFIEGVVVYGSPPLQIQTNAIKEGTIEGLKVLELTRLVIQTDKKNAASFLVGNSLKMLPKPSLIVSYADEEYKHYGYVYQATNWIYTGSTVSHCKNYFIDGKRVHVRTLTSRGITSVEKWAKENDIYSENPKPKHRYFYFCGDKKQKKQMRKNLSYTIIPEYPKGDSERYDAGDRIKQRIHKPKISLR